MATRSAFLVDGVRTPIGSLGGSLSAVRADDLAAHALRALVARHPNLDLTAIDDAFLGCANQAGEDNRNVARMATLLAGIPHTVPAETVNRLCASGLSAVQHAARAILSGEGDLILAGGVEHMTRAPYAMSKPSKAFGNDSQMYDTTFGWRFVNPEMKRLYGTDAMGETAENLADQHSISREDQDALALRSQQRAAAAVASLALLIAAGTTWFRPTSFSPATALATRATVTQPTRQRLTDGSQIELNGDARVLVEFSPAVRRVTIVRGEAFNFSRLGTHLERADNTARILDVKYHILLPRVEDVGGALDYYQWAALLRSVSAFETYRLIYRDQIFPIKVAELLILEQRMPRSLAACAAQVNASLAASFWPTMRRPSACRASCSCA